MARTKKNLVIVESPAKAKTINKYLGSDFAVKASMGHVRDLPKKSLGIDIDDGFKASYQIIPAKRETIQDLKRQAAQSNAVYLATDPDREGEAIAWHLKNALGLSDDRTFRITFNEITQRAIQQAIARPGHINEDRVNAQQARRFLDRIVGYKLSPLLWKKVARRLSAGRVQSVAVRLIADREREIQTFKPEEYWRITATLAPEGPGARADQFEAELAEWAGAKFQATDEKAAMQVVDALGGAVYRVSKVEPKDRVEKAPPPFQTSTLQQQASIRLRFSGKRTMMLAQQLYEGVDLGSEGAVGLITYMRTDSLRIADEALQACRGHIRAAYGPAYLPDKPNRFVAGKQAQEAHEAIRPTDLKYTPEMVRPYLGRDQWRLYDLIYRRFVASQMKPAVFAVTNVEVGAAAGLFRAQGRILKFDGYRRALAPAGKQDDQLLPRLTVDQVLELLGLAPSQHFTQPPPRYTEATLVKALEKEGIGRPSTYAPIISTIQERAYVEQKDRRFYATELGMVVTDLLVQHFPTILDVKFTSTMEDELDGIEQSHLDWIKVLHDFYDPFVELLKSAETNMEPVRGIETEEKCDKCGAPMMVRWSKAGRFLGCSGYPECKNIKRLDGADRAQPVETEHKCPNCGKPMLRREGKAGPFLGCSGYPKCKTTMNLDAEGNPVPSTIETEHKCPKCGKPMVLRQSRRGPFLGCTGYPKCRGTMPVDDQGNPVPTPTVDVACDKCGSPMAVKRGRRGSFLGCTAYPKCRNTMPIPDDLKQQLQAAAPAKASNPLAQIDSGEVCENCGAPMKIRNGRRGPFLGCSKYPKCRTVREVPERLLEQIAAAAGTEGTTA